MVTQAVACLKCEKLGVPTSRAAYLFDVVPEWGGGVVLKTIDLNGSERSNRSRVALAL